MFKYEIDTTGYLKYRMLIPVETAIGEITFAVDDVDGLSQMGVIMVPADKYREACINGKTREFYYVMVEHQPMTIIRRNKYNEFNRSVRETAKVNSLPYVVSVFSQERGSFLMSLCRKKGCLHFGVTVDSGITRSFWLIEHAPFFPILCHCNEVTTLAKLFGPKNPCDWKLLADVYQEKIASSN
jgi:hypothetical protein